MIQRLHSFVIFCLVTAVFSSPSAVAGEQIDFGSLVNGISPEVVGQLKTDGEVLRFDRAGIGIALAPDHPSLTVIRRENDELQPDAMAEGLYLIPYAEGFRGISLELYNITRGISRIAQVKYHSDRRDAVVPLFDNVYRVKSLEDKRRVDDGRVESIPVFESIVMHMKEINLGSAYYEAQFVYDGESLGFFVRNLTPLRSLLKVVDDENMRISIILFPTELGYLAYGYCGVKLSNRNIVFSMMDPFSGFYKRLYAMVTWMKNSLHGTENEPFIGPELDF